MQVNVLEMVALWCACKPIEMNKLLAIDKRCEGTGFEKPSDCVG